MATKRKREPIKQELVDISGGDGVQQFQRAAQDLKTKSQSRIQHLTNLAEALVGSAPAVVQVMEHETKTATKDRIQPLVSVVDCILKKVGKDYKAHFSLKMPDMFRKMHTNSDPAIRGWLQKMVNDSWRRHDLLPAVVLDQVDAVFSGAPPPIQIAQQWPAQQQAFAVPCAVDLTVVSPPQVGQVAPGATGAWPSPPPMQQGDPYLQPPVQWPPQASQVPSVPLGGVGIRTTPVKVEDVQQPAARIPPMKAPPMKAPPPAKAQAAPGTSAATFASAQPAQAQGQPQQAQQAAAPAETAAGMQRRLEILTKIVERKNPNTEELQEIMKVPEIRKAIAMQQKGQKQEAMALLSRFKQDLERKCLEMQTPSIQPPAADPRLAGPPAKGAPPPKSQQLDPRRPIKLEPEEPPKPGDLQQPDPRLPDQRQGDPRQAKQPEPAHFDPRRLESTQPAKTDGRRVVVSEQPPQRQASPLMDDDDLPEAERLLLKGASGSGPVPARQILQGLPSIGFSEAWLRQFLLQLPAGALPVGPKPEAPSIGRRVLSASGEQMVYVDPISPHEVLCLLQMVFLLEERLRHSNGGAIDLAQRVPHTFSFLQMEPAIDVMLKRLFDELPHQCSTTGLRFATREKLRKHHDMLYRRRVVTQQKQRISEARGWMETIPEWVGNRDLVVGPALFKLGGTAEDSAKAQDLGAARGTDGDGGDGELRWSCPLDERRSVCPISGELLDRAWSPILNDWVFTDVVAVELGSAKPLRFEIEEEGPPRLSETAMLLKKSCFYNTPPPKRFKALQECSSVHAWADAGPISSDAGAAPTKKPAIVKASSKRGGDAGDPDLAALAKPRPPTRKFF